MQQSAIGHESAATIDSADHADNAVAWGARMLRFTPSGAGTLSVTVSSADFAKLLVYTVQLDQADPTGVVVTPRPLSAASTSFDVTLTHAQLVDLVVAVDGGSALAATSGAPVTDFTYNASFAP